MGPRNFECRIHRIYLWMSLVALASCVVGVVALASPSWTEGGYGDYEYLQTGIILFCHHRNSQPGDRLCAPLLFGSDEKWFEAVRVMSLLSWVLLFTVFVLGLVLHFQDEQHTFSLPLVTAGFLAGLIGVVAAIVLAVFWTAQNVIHKYDVSISWGYAVYVIWHVITIFLFTSVCVAGRHIWISQFKARHHHK
ncbi:uncharacterized protein [Littorina saxatilis]|uniref:Uncharacterized protein n=1 Tax=Littorina saxatilis TaxID=31220 RepID=A0AAN9GM29_9CAEN